MNQGALQSDARVGTVLADRYRIDALIGEGGMGKVYSAEHVLMRKRLAVKVLHKELTSVPEVVARFEREAMAAANIDHPNVAAATDFGKLPDGAVFLVLEYVQGKSLRDEIARGPFPADRALSITRQVASGLASAHALGIVHRDLKPENVMLVEKGGDPDFVKVLDFGIAKVPVDEAAQGPKSSGQPLTKAGMVFGTPEYMAPEQALGHTVDHRADLYGLGVILYEMLAGVRPFSSQSQVGILGQQLSKPPPTFAERAPGIAVPPAVEQIVQKLLARDVKERFQSAGEVVAAIDQLLAPLPGRGSLRFTLADGSPNSVRGSQPSLTDLGAPSRPSLEVSGPLPAFPLEGTPLPSSIFGKPLPADLPQQVPAPTPLAPTPLAPPSAADAPAKRISKTIESALAVVGERFKGLVAAAGRAWLGVEQRAEGVRAGLPDKVKAPLARVSTRALLVGALGVTLSIALLLVLLVSVASGPSPAPTPSARLAIASSAPSVAAPTPSVSAASAPSPSDGLPESPEALEALAKKDPKDTAVLLALATAYLGQKEFARATGAVARALSANPAVRDDPRASETLFQTAQVKASADASFSLLEGPMGARGADVIFRLWSAPDAKPAIKQRTERWLRSKDFERASSPALNVTVALLFAQSCQQRYALLLRAKNVGDARTLEEVKKLKETSGCGPKKTDDCHACLRTDSRLDEAIRALESRGS